MTAAGHKLFATETGHFTFDGAYAAARTLITAHKKPDAIFAANDLMAFGVLDAIRDVGLRAPDDISVVGFDGAHAGAWPAYNLTTVVQPVEAMFLRAIDLLRSRKAAANPPAETIFIHGEFLIRKSARIPPHWPTQSAAITGGRIERTRQSPQQKRRKPTDG